MTSKKVLALSWERLQAPKKKKEPVREENAMVTLMGILIQVNDNRRYRQSLRMKRKPFGQVDKLKLEKAIVKRARKNRTRLDHAKWSGYWNLYSKTSYQPVTPDNSPLPF